MVNASTFLRRSAACLAGAALVTAAGCGARGPLDLVVVEEAPADATADAPVRDAAAETAPDALADVVDAASDVRESGTGFDGGPIFNCGSCVVQSCGTQILTCVTSTTCRTALQCVVQKCVTGGAPNPQCLGDCAGGNLMTEQQLLSVFACIIGSCGASCAGVLGGLGGPGGGGGGGDGG